MLLVDDEPDQVEMYQLALEVTGYEVAVAYTGGDALAQARSRVPDVIVLDLRLPDLTGWDVCAALHADPCTANIPVILLTAAAVRSLPEQAAAAGCAALLLKPCFPDQLTGAVRRLVAPQQA